MSSITIQSPRGHNLALSITDEYNGAPILTVEIYCKWYSLFVVDSARSIREISFSELEDFSLDEAPYIDHVPNPKAVQRFAEKRGYELDELALKLLLGRWVLVRGVD